MQKHVLRRFFLAFLLVCGSSQAYTDNLSIDHATGTISWYDAHEAWDYQLSTGNWQWKDVDSVYSYDAQQKVWIDQVAGERWQYDESLDVWVHTSGAHSYNLLSPDVFFSEVWRHDQASNTWQMLQRHIDGHGNVSFAPIEQVSWQYNSERGAWHYRRSGGDASVPASQDWQLLTSDNTWLQTAPGTGKQWRYAGGRWQDVATAQWWKLRFRTNNDVVWNLIGQSRGALGDRVQWRHELATGEWREEEVESPTTIMQAFTWAYHATDHVWYQQLAPTRIRSLVPQFPPTPFAQQKNLIDSVIIPLLTEGVHWGSPDGSGVGTVNVLDHSLINRVIPSGARDLPTSGVFEYNGIPAVTVTDTLLLDGDLELHAVADGVLILGDGSPAGDVTIKPDPGAAHAQLIFNPEEGKTIEVQIKNDVGFQALDDLPFYLTFRGKGTTTFRLPSGKLISFGPENPDTGNEGVHIQVLMELEAEDVAANKSQVVFGPWSYASEDDNADTDQTSWLQLGRRSFITFVSQNAEGLNEDTYPGYGVMAFDVAHAGAGRTILDMARGKVAGDGLDAGVNVYGNLIAGTDGGAVQASDFRTQVSYNKRAGIRASLKIIDDVALQSVVPDITAPTLAQATAWVARGASDARGMVVLNHNQSYPRLLANLEQAADLENSNWATTQVSNGYQPGFILGNNGEIDVCHNLFIDFIASSVNQALDPEYLGGVGKTTAQTKHRNPSALIVDGFGTFAASSDTSWDMAYLGASTSHALVTLRGSAGLLARCGASAQTGDVLAAITTHDDESETLDATIGLGAYDAVFCPVLDSSGVLSTHEAITFDASGNPVTADDSGALCLDGEHAIDVEGSLTVKSILGRFGFAPNGFINIPSLKVDHTGREILTQEEGS